MAEVLTGGAVDLAAWRERFLRREPEIHAFVDEPGRFARVQAEVERGRSPAAIAAVATGNENAPPLAGVLLGVKDIFHVAGLPTRAGSRVPAEVLAGEEAESVARLRAAGAIVVGKTVTTEFAYFAPGPTRNPADLTRTPGGSSSGSAAAVAAGLCDLALGTQTIGSIGRPAAFCGVVGYKPSYERISRAGVIPLAPSLDHVGLFARDVDGITRAAAVLVDGWRPGVTARRISRLGIPRGPYFDALSPAGGAHFAGLCIELETLGFEILDVDVMPDFAAIAERHRRLVACEAAEVHADWFARFGAGYAAKTAELLQAGRAVGRDEAAAARAGRLALRSELEAAMHRAGIDLWLSPPAVGPAPSGLDSTGDPVMNLPWTHSGLPSLVIPAGTTALLPMGAQLAGRFGADEELLAWGAEFADELATLRTSKGER